MRERVGVAFGGKEVLEAEAGGSLLFSLEGDPRG